MKIGNLDVNVYLVENEQTLLFMNAEGALRVFYHADVVVTHVKWRCHTEDLKAFLVDDIGMIVAEIMSIMELGAGLEEADEEAIIEEVVDLMSKILPPGSLS